MREKRKPKRGEIALITRPVYAVGGVKGSFHSWEEALEAANDLHAEDLIDEFAGYINKVMESDEELARHANSTTNRFIARRLLRLYGKDLYNEIFEPWMAEVNTWMTETDK